MKATIVPNRNMILLSLAAGHALSIGFDTVAYAAHAGDHTIYPDCRPEFASAMENALGLADWQKLGLHRPFVDKTKADLVRIGHELGVPSKALGPVTRDGICIAADAEPALKEKRHSPLRGSPTQPNTSIKP